MIETAPRLELFPRGIITQENSKRDIFFLFPDKESITLSFNGFCEKLGEKFTPICPEHLRVQLQDWVASALSITTSGVKRVYMYAPAYNDEKDFVSMYMLDVGYRHWNKISYAKDHNLFLSREAGLVVLSG